MPRAATPHSKRTRYTEPVRRSVPYVVRRRDPLMEVKAFSAAPFSNSPVNDLMSTRLTDVQVGPAYNQRVGKMIQGVEFHYRGWFFLSYPQPWSVVRLIIFRWNDDTPPDTQQILNGFSPAATYNVRHQGNWTILRDRMFELNQHTLAPGDPPSQFGGVGLSFHGKFKYNQRMVYDDEDNDQDQGAVYALCIADTNNVVSVTMTTQLYYTEL